MDRRQTRRRTAAQRAAERLAWTASATRQRNVLLERPEGDRRTEAAVRLRHAQRELDRLDEESYDSRQSRMEIDRPDSAGSVAELDTLDTSAMDTSIPELVPIEPQRESYVNDDQPADDDNEDARVVILPVSAPRQRPLSPLVVVRTPPVRQPSTTAPSAAAST